MVSSSQLIAVADILIHYERQQNPIWNSITIALFDPGAGRGFRWHSEWPVAYQAVRILSFNHSHAIQKLFTTSATVHKFLMNVSITVNGH